MVEKNNATREHTPLTQRFPASSESNPQREVDNCISIKEDQLDKNIVVRRHRMVSMTA